VKYLSGEIKREHIRHILDIYNYGEYRRGLTNKEIDAHLRVRAIGTKYAKYSTKQLRNKFSKIAGVNTGAFVTCPICQKPISLMYRSDVERFVDQMFYGIPTFWD